MKLIWLKNDIPYADMLIEAIPNLTREFLDHYGKEFNNYSKPFNLQYQIGSHWTADGVKLLSQTNEFQLDLSNNPEIEELFPTAVDLTRKLGDSCLCSCYSLLEPNSIIERHTDKEFKPNTHIRIHIPLIIPEGDAFFEIDGYELDWSNIFGINTQVIHSAHNYTPYRRLVYLLMVSRESLGAEPGIPWSQEIENQSLEFQRGRYPKIVNL